MFGLSWALILHDVNLATCVRPGAHNLTSAMAIALAFRRATLRSTVRNIPGALVCARSLCTTLEDELGLRRSMGRKLRGDRQQPLRQDRLQEKPVPSPEPANESGPVARIATAPLRPRVADALVADYEGKARSLYSTCPGFVGALLSDPELTAETQQRRLRTAIKQRYPRQIWTAVMLPSATAKPVDGRVSQMGDWIQSNPSNGSPVNTAAIIVL